MKSCLYHVAVGRKHWVSATFADAIRAYTQFSRSYVSNSPVLPCCTARTRTTRHITVKMENTVLVVLSHADITWIASMCADDDEEEDLTARRYNEDMVLQMVGDMYAQRLEDPREKLFQGASTMTH